MGEIKLDRIFDSGWSPNKSDRISLALNYLSGIELCESIPVLIGLSEKYEKQLQLQTKNLTGSGSQQDFIDAYIIAYEACAEALRKLQSKKSDT